MTAESQPRGDDENLRRFLASQDPAPQEAEALRQIGDAEARPTSIADQYRIRQKRYWQSTGGVLVAVLIYVGFKVLRYYLRQGGF